MVGVCSHGVVAAAMPALEVVSKASAGAGKHTLRQVRVAPSSSSSSQSAFLGSALRHSTTCAFARRAGVVSVAAAASGDDGSRVPEAAPEVYFYSGSAPGQSPAGGKRVKWEIGSVAGAEKEIAAGASPNGPSWSNLGSDGGKRTDLKKILVLGAGLLADPCFCLLCCILSFCLYDGVDVKHWSFW